MAKSISRKSAIGVFDSGVGGITTLAELMKILPNENFVYLADKSGAPYGNKSQEYILSRTTKACNYLSGRGVKAIVIACNTATNVGISELRSNRTASFSECIFVGLEPAIRPSIMQTQEGKILVLLTPATAKQEKFNQLINNFDTKRLIIYPQPNLATKIEENIASIERLEGFVGSILSRHKDIVAVVLGCSHYVYIKKMIEVYYAGRVKVFDGNEGAANRLASLLKAKNLLSDNKASGYVEFVTL